MFYLMYKKYILIFNFIITTVSCGFDDNSTYFVGKILKKTNDKISILKDQVVLNEAVISNDGDFTMVIDSVQDGLYNFKHLPEFQYILLEKKDSLVLRLNAVDFDESLVFTGKGSSKNNYLIDIFLNNENEQSFINSKLRKKPNEFSKIIDSLIQIKMLKFDNFKKLKRSNSTSNQILYNAIKLPLYSKKEAYISNVKNKNNLNEISQDFYEYRKDVDFNMEILSNFKPYLDYLILRINNESYTNIKDYSRSQLKYNLDRINFVNDNISNPTIKSKILRYMAFEFLLQEDNLTEIDTFLNEFTKVSLDKNVNLQIKQLYSNISSLQIEKKIPKIELIDNINNKVVSSNLVSDKPIIYVFWSYDQNSHQISLFDRIFDFLKNNYNYNFYCININSDKKKWKETLKYIEKNKNMKHFKTTNFEVMSKKMVLNNLNKIIVTSNKGRIITISDITKLNSLKD
ncbi:MAG: hypothetical protein P8I26_05720 [Flavobacteriaceae bacterium]|nr:hypothetical protein [Flavobacteriaceae bacterium]